MIVIIAVVGGGVWYAMQSSATAPASDAQMPAESSASPNQQGQGTASQPSPAPSTSNASGAARADVDADVSSIVSGYDAEATQANSENGTEGESQFNSSMDSQAVYE